MVGRKNLPGLNLFSLVILVKIQKVNILNSRRELGGKVLSIAWSKNSTSEKSHGEQQTESSSWKRNKLVEWKESKKDIKMPRSGFHQRWHQ